MSPSAIAGAPASAARPNAKAANAWRRERKQKPFITRSRRTTTNLRRLRSPSSDLRIEMDGLGLPLLIIRAILRRHRQRVAILHRGEDALRLRFESRVRRRIDELGLRQRAVRVVGEAHLRDIDIGG